MRERIGILSDFRLVVRALKLDKEFQFVYIVTPSNEDDEGDELKS